MNPFRLPRPLPLPLPLLRIRRVRGPRAPHPRPPGFPATALPGLLVLAAAAVAPAMTQAAAGKLRLTGGVSTVDGAAGGGLSPWAVIGTQATEDEVGVSVHVSRATTRDYALTAAGVALGWNDRLELSFGRQRFDASPAVALNGVAPFGVAPGVQVRLDVLGAKWRVAGDAVLDSDRWAPQVAVGVLHKRVDPASLGGVFDFLGVRREGTELYVSATKLWLARGLLFNGTLRYTRANQGGLLGFGAAAPGRDRFSVQPELAVAWLLRRDLAVGVEWRSKPNNLQALGRAAGLGDGLREDAWRDVFVAWAPTRNLSVTLAHVDLGRVVPGVTAARRQRGTYVSVQAAL